MADVIALYDPTVEPYGLVLHKFGDWQVVSMELPETDPIPVLENVDLVVCSIGRAIPRLQQAYTHSVPVVYIGAISPTKPSPALEYTPYVMTSKQSIEPMADMIRRAITEHKQTNTIL